LAREVEDPYFSVTQQGRFRVVDHQAPLAESVFSRRLEI